MAQTLKFGKGTWATKTGSSMAYNDQNGNYKPLPFNVERDSIATRVNKQGLIEVVGKDKLRIDYTNSAKGVALLEPSRSNLIIYSEDFSGSSWALQRVSILSNNEIAPNGTLTATKFTEDTSNDSHQTRPTSTISLSAGQPYTYSCFVKKAERDEFRIENISQSGAYFNLQNKTINADNTSIIKNTQLQELSNGWFKCSVTIQETSRTADYIYLQIAKDGSKSYQGDGTSGIYIWGAMVEQGSYATSYIPTSGSTYQRQADVANGSGNGEVFNDSEGVLMANFSSFADSTFKYITISDGSIQNRITIILLSNNNIYGQVRAVNSEVFFRETSGISIEQNNKIAVSYKTNQCKLFVNGFQIGSTDTFASMPLGLNTLAFDDGSGAGDFYGNTKELGYYDIALTDEELEYMTSYRSLNEIVTELNLNTL